MAVDVERLIVRLEASQAKFEKQLAKANGTADRRARQIERRFSKMNSAIGSQFSRLGLQLGAAFAGGAAIRGAQQLIDAATRIENALKVAGLSGEELARVYDKLFESAHRNGAPLEALVQLYGRAALAQKELNVTQAEMIGFADNVGKALRVAGTSAEQSRGALIQLSQAIGAGIVRAEEFNSILEGALPIAQAAAAGLEEAGGSVAKLRQLIVDGKVSSEAFFRAFEAGAVILEEKVANAELTVSQGFVRLQNVLIKTAGKLDDATDASGKTGEALDRLATAVEVLGDFMVRVANGPLGQFIGKLAQLDAIAERIVKTLSALSFNDEMFGAIGDAIAPQAELTEQAVKDFAFRNNIGPQVKTTEKTSRVVATPDPVSLRNFSVPDTGSGKKVSRGGSRENDYQREIAQIKERTASIEAMTAAQAAINPLVEDYGYAVERAASIIELENAAKKAGLEITPQLRAQIEGLAGAYATASAEAERLAESQEKAREQAEDMRALGKDVLSGFISDMRNGVSATEALANALTKVADKLLEMALNNLFGGLGGGLGGGGGLLGGAIIPGILHRGGIAGRDGYGHGRAVSPTVFTGAKRYHKGGVAGLQPGEVPAILQKGEVVIPRGASMQGGAAYAPTYNIDASGSDNPEQTRTIVMQALKEYDKGNYQRFLANMGNARKRNAI